jgi:hypothetical protein
VPSVDDDRIQWLDLQHGKILPFVAEGSQRSQTVGGPG